MKNFIGVLLFLMISGTSFSQNFNFTFQSKFSYNEDLSGLWGYTDDFGNEYAIVGVNNGVSIVNVTNPANPVEISFIPGPNSIWREARTWGHYAYITNETSGGLLIIDLNPLPSPNNQPITLTTYNFTEQGLNTIHSLFIDENGVLYLNGSNLSNGGTRMYDVATNPLQPAYLGHIPNWYVHDGNARGDTVYLAHINNGFFSIFNVADKQNPILLATQNTPSNFTHNLWFNDDGKYLFSTDEVSAAYIAAYDISDLTDIKEVHRTRSPYSQGVIPHNTLFLNNYLVTSYYRDGVTIHDVTKPENMVLVGRYDTSPLAGNGFNGSWGVYCYFASGTVILSDIEEGLIVLSPNYQRASFFEGNVTDSLCNIPVNNATITIVGTGVQTGTDLNGNFKTGYHIPGNYTVTISAPGYQTKTLNIQLTTGQTVNLNTLLFSPNASSISGIANDQVTGNPIEGVQVLVENSQNQYLVNSDNTGQYVYCGVQPGSYSIIAGKWGYDLFCETGVTLTSSSNNQNFNLSKRYFDDFSLDFGWTVSGNANIGSGMWTREKPLGTTLSGSTSNPAQDLNSDCSDKAYVTGNSSVQVGADDVDALTRLQSPIFDLTQYNSPSISYYTWFFNDGGTGNPNDTMIVKLSNGVNTIILEKIYGTIGGPQSEWNKKTYLLNNLGIQLTANMQLIVEVNDYNPGHIVEGGFDHFEVIENSMTSIDKQNKNSTFLVNTITSDFLVVQQMNKQNFQFTIFDLSGKIILQEDQTSNGRIDVRELSQGCYFIMIDGKKENIQKFIKSN